MFSLLKNPLGDGCLSRDEGRGAWLLAFVFQFPFACYLRFRLSTIIHKIFETNSSFHEK